MKARRGSRGVLAGAFLLVAAVALAQTGGDDEGGKDEIPEAALLTERGTALVQRLKQLRHTESRLGARHPSLPEVQEQIAEIKRQLKAWEPAPNPFRSADDPPETTAAGKPIPAMNEEDLRQVVLNLTAELDALKRRVSALEKQLDN